MLAAGHEPTKKYATAALDLVSTIAKTKVGIDALHSTIGRHAARAVGRVQVDELEKQWNLLLANMGKGDLKTFNKPVFPKGEQMGVGFHEAPRGVLSHWVVIEDGKIKNYQCVVPSPGMPRRATRRTQPGAYEACLIDNPVADPEKPLEVLRTVHSFDPCLAAHTEIVKVKAA
jgi:hydrogenase large subunit